MVAVGTGKGRSGRWWFTRHRTGYDLPMPDRAPPLPDPDGTAQRVALEIMALPSERRGEAVEKAADMFTELAGARGASRIEAIVFALGMRRRVRDAMRAIEGSAGGACGKG